MFFEPETNKALSTWISFCLKTEIFSPAWPTTHLYSVRRKWSPKTHLSKTLSRVESFINAVLLYLCGSMKTEVFANDYVMVLDRVYPAHAYELRRHHLAGSDTSKCAGSHWRWYRFQSMLRFCLDRQKGLKNATYGRGFVLKTEKVSVSYKSGYVWRGPKLIRHWSVNSNILSMSAVMWN